MSQSRQRSLLMTKLNMNQELTEKKILTFISLHKNSSKIHSLLVDKRGRVRSWLISMFVLSNLKGQKRFHIISSFFNGSL